MISYSYLSGQILLYRHYGRAEPLSGFLALLFFLPFLVALVMTVYYWLKYKEINLLKISQYFKPLEPHRKHMLQAKFNYYKSLSSTEKNDFEYRVNHFMVNKNFISETGDEISDDMKVLIAASAIQLTFGLRPVYLSNFKNVIFADPLSADANLINSNSIIIPWKDFLHGYQDNADGVNEGLRILAVALKIQDRISKPGLKMFSDIRRRKWVEVSKKEAQRLIKSGQTRFGSVKEINPEEYFAVSVVYFFEKPKQMKEKHPELYFALSKLLGQNPLKMNSEK